jgi:hypothetical protein
VLNSLIVTHPLFAIAVIPHYKAISQNLLILAEAVTTR